MIFKVGQTVKLIDNSGMVASLGATAKIVRCYCFEIKVEWFTGHIKFINGNKCVQKNGYYEKYHFVPALKIGEQLLFDFMKQK